MDKPEQQTFKKDDSDSKTIRVQNTSLNAEEAKDKFESVLSLGEIVGGRYRVLAVLGQGGAGVVYKVEQIFLGDVYALKFLHAEKSTDKAVARFHKEANAAHLLKHNNLVRVHDFGFSENNQPFFVMDYVEGTPLSERIKFQGCLSVSEALDVFIQVCDALSYAHESGVVHRDLKPSNIMLTKLGPEEAALVKIVDFGIAKILQLETDEANELTRTGEVFGSPFYMSPEQCMGHSIDHRSDIYSLGCSLFEALTGLPPFSGESALSIMMKHQLEEPPTLKETSLGKDFPQSLEQVVRRLLSKDPSVRYQSMMSVKHALQLVKEGKSINSQSSKLATKSTRRWLLILIAGTAILATAAFFAIKSSLPVEAPAKISSSFDNPTPIPTESVIPETPPENFYAELPLSEARGKPWKLHFLADRSLGTISPINNSSAHWEGTKAKGLVTFRSAQPLCLSPSAAVVENPQLLRHFRGDEIAEIRLAQNPFLGDDFFFFINHMSGLRVLDLEGTETTDRGLAYLEKLPDIRELSVSNTKGVTGNELSRLKCLRALHILKADHVPNMSKVLASIARNKSNSIMELQVMGTNLSDADLQKVGDFPKLTMLCAAQNKGITDVGVSKLLKLKNLEFLDLRFCPLTPACIQYLRQLPKLEVLNITTDKWSKNEQQALHSALPRCKFDVFE